MVMRPNVFIKRNASTILTFVGGAGLIATSVMAVKTTPKALYLLEEAKSEKGDELTKMEILRVAGPAYIPTIITGAATLACIFGANVLNKCKQAALMSGYAMLDQTFKEYRKKVEELYGEYANEKIEEEIYKDKYNENGEKIRLYYDNYSKRFFEATAAQVRRAEYNVNRNLMLRDYAYLDEFYDDLGLEPYDNYTKGWSTGMCFDMYWQSWIDFGYDKGVTEDGKEYITIYIYEEPIEDFEDYC